MAPFNLYSELPESAADEPEAYRGRAVRFGPQIGAAEIGGSVYELQPGQRNCPYDYECGREEWPPRHLGLSDSDKIGAFPGNDGDEIIVRRSSGVEYWDGES
jgi:hypothetical protein